MPSAPELAGGGSVKPDDRLDPFVCPRGHHNIRMGAYRFHCGTCRRAGRDVRSWDKDALVDLREEEPPLAEGAGDEDADEPEGAGDLFLSYYPGVADKIRFSNALWDALDNTDAVRLFSKDNKAAFVPTDESHPNAYLVNEHGQMTGGWAKYELDAGDPDRGRYRVTEDDTGVWIVEFGDRDETVAGRGGDD